ncbi:MAG: sigma 54-interacting transcriptional regulator [Sandaracinaceae bacterium]|nr:sigma 54-interacting transcriptional regulator [Sandaracinaceae bacterium]
MTTATIASPEAFERSTVEVRVADADAGVIVGETPVRIGSASGNEIVIADPTVSRFHAELRWDGDELRLVDCGSKNGTHVGPLELRGTNAIVHPPLELLVGQTLLRVSVGARRTQRVGGTSFGRLHALSRNMRSLFATAEQVARSDASVLLHGESGCGKELLAEALHASSERSAQPFVIVDCGAMLPSLFASEIFGHERGAFTGADRRHVGALERASGGTLFLDELGELPPDLQAALLGALERRRARRLGGSSEYAFDVRVIGATHRDLRGDVNDGRFRLDLYYRLAVVSLRIPPLREHIEDVPILVRRFLDDEGASAREAELFPEPVLRAWSRHPFPGNVRELRNVVRRALALGRPVMPDGSEGPSPTPSVGAPVGEMPPWREARARVVEDFERTYLRTLLDRCEGNVRRASREARLDRSHLIDLLKKHGVE